MKSRRPPLNPVIAARLNEARHEFERWRQARTNRSRIPANLWNLATKIARACGVFRTARELHLNHRALRNRIAPSQSRAGRKEPAPAGFVELMPPSAIRFSECTLEIERGKGTKIRIHLKSPEAPDLGAISNAILMGRV